MRPINLIPPEERRGIARTTSRSGGMAYVVIGLLAVVLVGVMLVVLANNDISDKKSELSDLQTQATELQAQADQLTPYTTFHSTRDARVSTITQLADSRFDWERVMRELSKVLPGNIWLTNLTGTVSPGVEVEGSQSISLRASVTGPALEMTGCATSQDAVAGFLSALKQIDGVTRVAVQSSTLPSQAAGAAGGATVGAITGDSADCQTRNFIAKFEIVAAFDAAPVASAAATGDATAVAPVTTPAGADTAATTATTTPAPAAGG